MCELLYLNVTIRQQFVFYPRPIINTMEEKIQIYMLKGSIKFNLTLTDPTSSKLCKKYTAMLDGIFF